MNIWVTSDTHYEHEEMTKLCMRPANFTQLIMQNWNNMVKEEDLVIHLGDVSWVKHTYNGKLRGNKILVKGNHDGETNTWYMQHGFSFVCKQFVWKYGGMNIVFSHKPLIFHEYDLNIHGHLHNCAKIESVCPHYLISLEETNYKPVQLIKIVEHIKNTRND